jgi:xanthine dehydrogenase YagS FAD-binding subunit
VALAARASKGVCEEIRLVLGGIAPVPVVTPIENMIKGKKLDDGLIAEAVEASIREARPLPMNGYKVDLTKALVRRALASVAKDTEGR